MSDAAITEKYPDLDCCVGFANVDYTKADISGLCWMMDYIKSMDPSIVVAFVAIIFNPLFWNVVARWEHRTRRLTSIFGSSHVGCYSLAIIILLLNVYRSHSITVAMQVHPKLELMDTAQVYYLGVAFLVLGLVFVVTSFLALGFTGTFLGDYFGILMDHKVTGFPFNVTENPMYWGSTANYLGLALMNASPVGVLLTAVVALSYKVAIAYEGPFTEEIYKQRSLHSKHK